MLKQARIELGWRGNNHDVQFQLAVINFQDENGIHFSYLPSLDVTGYGQTQEEADESLKIVLHEYLNYTTEHQTLLKDLKNHGWIIRKKGRKVSPPSLATLIAKNEELNTILTAKDFTKKNEAVSLPALA